MRQLLTILLTILAINSIFPSQTFAVKDLESRGDVLEFLEQAFEAQVSLNEHERSLKEIDEILSPYFSEDYNKNFLEENLVEMDGKFLTFGSDFALYYIPFFHFSDDTKVVISDEEIYVYEFFPANGDGPVTYDDHYEGLYLKKLNGEWKVIEYLYDNIPEDILKSEQAEANTQQTAFVHPITVQDFITPYSQIKLGVNPLQAFISLGTFLSIHERDKLYTFFQQNELALK